MSMFGNWNQDQLYDDIKRFFEEDCGTLEEYHYVMMWYMKHKELRDDDEVR